MLGDVVFERTCAEQQPEEDLSPLSSLLSCSNQLVSASVSVMVGSEGDECVHFQEELTIQQFFGEDVVNFDTTSQPEPNSDAQDQQAC